MRMPIPVAAPSKAWA